MRISILISLLLIISLSGFGQNRLVGGPCEGCEAVFEYGNETLSPVDTLTGFNEADDKLKISGTIYQSDGKTPAEGVILYVYNTDEAGVYPTTGDESDWARRHGYIRGWVKTGSDGKYMFYTVKPGSYGRLPAHIHPTILEPNGRYYYIEDYLFDKDPLLTDRRRNRKNPRGGSGIVSLIKENGIWVAQRDIILGRNIPNYD